MKLREFPVLPPYAARGAVQRRFLMRSLCYVLNVRWKGRRSSYGRIFRTIFRTGCSRMRSAETSNCDISLRSICTITIRVPLIRPNRRRSPDKLRLRLSIADSDHDLMRPERRCNGPRTEFQMMLRSIFGIGKEYRQSW